MTVIAPPGDLAAAPVLIFYHGTRQSAESVRAFSGHSFDALAAQGVAVVYPDGFERDWNCARDSATTPARHAGIDDVEFTLRLVDTLHDRLGTDTRSVHAAGFSLGGQMVIRLVHEVPEHLAGAALLSSTQPADDNFVLAADHRRGQPPSGSDSPHPVPVLVMHGTSDPLTPYDGGITGYRGVLNLRGRHLSAPATARYYAARNGITAEPYTTPLAGRTESDPTSATRTDYRQDGHAPVTLVTVHGGGHQVHNAATTPARWLLGRNSKNIAAADVVADFLGLKARAATRDHAPGGAAT